MIVPLLASALLGVSPCLAPPLDAPVTDPFRDPGCSYCAGNRGLEYRPGAGSLVSAAGDGAVSFAGSVAGTLYVVIDQGGGYRVTYGRLATISVRRGDRVTTGEVIATTTERFFFGLRLGEDYLDPAPSIGTVVSRPYLVPLDGSNRRPAPPPRLICR